MELILGIDVACRTAHVASLARPDGTFVWTGRAFFTRPDQLQQLWADLGLGEGDSVLVVMEPTRNAWAPLASWFRRRGAEVAMVSTTQSADLRAYYAKHTKNDRLDSRLLARLPLLHPEGLHRSTGDGPAEPLRRAVKLRDSIVARRTAVFARLDALLELLGPGWHDVLGASYGKTALAVLTRYADPTVLLQLGPARLTAFLSRHSRGHWASDHAGRLLAAARESVQLWEGGLDFAALAADIAAEAGQAQMLTGQIAELEQRIAPLHAEADPAGIVASAPGVGPTLAAVIVGRLGDPHRFTSLAAVRAFSGLVPTVNQSGQTDGPGRLTKAGDPLLRTALFMAAENARRTDPQLAAKYVRLMAADRHHNSAVCHLATTLLTRIAACWRAGEGYLIRDTAGRPINAEQGRRIVAEHHQVPPKTRTNARNTRQAQQHKQRTGRESQKSPSASTSRPATPEPTTARVA